MLSGPAPSLPPLTEPTATQVAYECLQDVHDQQQVSAEQSAEMQAMAAEQRRQSRIAAEHPAYFTILEAASDSMADGSDRMLRCLQENAVLVNGAYVSL